jgi:hypothetical protein
MNTTFKVSLLALSIGMLFGCGGSDSSEDTTSPVITLVGGQSIDFEAGTTYTDTGATAIDNVDGAVSVTTSGTVDTSVLGSYTITYSATDAAGNSSNDTRTVTVVDTIAPVISLSGSSSMTVLIGSTFSEPGVTATDSYQGVLAVTTTGSVDTSTAGTYTLTYTATDSSGNSASESRTVVVSATLADTTAPVLSLNGSAAMELLAGDSFTDPGATATDAVDGSVTVTTTGSVDSSTAGTYTLTYTATDSSGNTASDTRTITVLPSAALSLRVQNYFDGSAIEGAMISVSSTESGTEVIRTGTTDASGNLSISVADDSTRIVISGDADGFGEHSEIVLTQDQTVSLFLQPVNADVSFTPTAAADIEVSGINVVSLPANALVDEDGNAPTGDVSAEVTVIDPGVDPDLMPGNFETLDTATGEAGQIESFGAINATFEDSDGNSYGMGDGQTATVRIPLASGATSPPDTIPLYYFDEETGYWVEEGTATLVTDSSGSYYEGTVTHFTTWNADYLYDSIMINGCVEDYEGNPISGAEIETQGVDYSGQAYTSSSSDGSFSVAAKPSSTVLLSASTTSGLSRTSTVSTGTEDMTQSECIVLDNAAATVTLTWGENPRDLDTHFFGPNSETGESAFHVYYINKEETLDNSSIWLDVDDTSSYGPEVTTISSFPYAGRYTYAIYLFSGSSDIAASPARVELNYSGNTQIFSPPEGDATVCWSVFDFVVDDSGAITVETNATWENYSYCHAGAYGSETSDRSMNNEADAPSVLRALIEQKYYAK